MTNDQDSKYKVANFRVRLFLSVDLSGSTAFKNSEDGEMRERASPKWVTTFETFYRDYPAKFRTNYANTKTPRRGNDNCPSLWKAVGDELVFCGRVTNCTSIMSAIIAFIQTLHDYRKLFMDNQTPLDLKGAAWLATFPEPNRAVELKNSSQEQSFLTASEALEAAADHEPFGYDFLGKAIDTGFRVAGFAKPERFALSVQLARLLASCGPGSGFDYDIRFEQPATLKGVNGGEAYPVLYIDTMNHLAIKSMRVKERKLLKKHESPEKQELKEYLDDYCEVVGTDEIKLPITATDPENEPPQSYLDHKNKISEHLETEQERGKVKEELETQDDENGGEIPEGAGLNPLNDQ